MQILAEFTLFPTDKGESVSSYVTEVVSLIRESGLKYRLNPMGTTIEGPLEEIHAVVARCFALLARYSNRIYGQLTYDYRAGRSNGLEGKIASVEQKGGWNR